MDTDTLATQTAKLMGTSILAALVIVFDYTLKYSGLKIPFPWYPNMKFDFTGIPIVLSLLMYGLGSSMVTSIVAGLGIFARSGNLLSAAMKTVAELSTVAGLYLGLKIMADAAQDTRWMMFSSLGGLSSRVIMMTFTNFYVLPNFYGVPIEATIGLLPLIAVFNIAQGVVNMWLGFFLNTAVNQRLTNYVP
jgi:riboflavin transporter FmnP